MSQNEDGLKDQVTFYEFLNSNNTSSDQNILKLREKCIDSGLYFPHLERWLSQFRRKRFFIIDSNMFKKEPFKYLEDIQFFLELNTNMDYSSRLVYNSDKSTFCVKNKPCSVFKNLSPIDDRSTEFLKSIYRQTNSKIKNILNHYEIKLPSWL